MDVTDPTSGNRPQQNPLPPVLLLAQSIAAFRSAHARALTTGQRHGAHSIMHPNGSCLSHTLCGGERATLLPIHTFIMGFSGA